MQSHLSGVFRRVLPARSKNRSLAEIDAMLETLVESEGLPDLVQISGGEPTIHPRILDILKLAKSKPIRHIMLNTNGVRIARDKDFVARLAELKPASRSICNSIRASAPPGKSARGRFAPRA